MGFKVEGFFGDEVRLLHLMRRCGYIGAVSKPIVGVHVVMQLMQPLVSVWVYIYMS